MLLRTIPAHPPRTLWLLLGCLLWTLAGGPIGCGPKEGDPCKEKDDCIVGQACKDGACVKAECEQASDCGKSKTCNAGLCVQEVLKPKACQSSRDCDPGQTCNAGECQARQCSEGKCPAGEVCIRGKVCAPQPPPCQSNADCKASELCTTVSRGKSVCVTFCRTNLTYPDNSHEGCWGGWGWCEETTDNPTIGLCIPPNKTKTRKAGETCNDLSDLNSDGTHDCAPDLSCIQGVCLGACDPSQGTSTNPTCPAGTYCATNKCQPLPNKQTGNQKRGESCSASGTGSTTACDGSADLFCRNNRCAKACDPRKGTDTNPHCAANEQCKEEVSQSHLGGVCQPKPTQKLGDPCDSNKLCLSGLRCSDGTCQKECTTNSDCASKEECYTIQRICVTSCDPAQGGGLNPACPAGTTCAANSRLKAGYCRKLPDFVDEGTKKLDETCSLSGTNACDGKQQLTCRSGRCVKACDMRQGTATNPNCQANEECAEGGLTSPLGGVCLPKPTQKEEEPCNTSTLRCLNNLTCSNSRCYRACTPSRSNPSEGCKADEWCVGFGSNGVCLRKCDPDKGVASNATCSKTHYCLKTSGTHKPGYCRGLPAPLPDGKQQLGQPCTPTATEQNCDSSKALTCHQRVCVKACSPKDGATNNPACDAKDTCEENTAASPLGGLCQPPPSQKLNEACDPLKTCLPGLMCRNLGSGSYCQTLCDPSESNECPKDATCRRISSNDGYCLANRTKTRKEHEECRGAPGTPAYHDCTSGYACAGTAGSSYRCLKSCSQDSDCGQGFACQFTSGGRVCTQTCTQDSDCTAYTSTCRTSGSTSSCL